MEERTDPIDDLASALEALESYEPSRTKRALRFLVDRGEIHALPRILPLTQHPSPAIRFVAKRAIQELRDLPPERRRNRPEAPPPVLSGDVSGAHPALLDPVPEAHPIAVGQSLGGTTSLDPRLEALLDAPVRRRPRPPAPGGVPMRWFHLEL